MKSITLVKKKLHWLLVCFLGFALIVGTNVYASTSSSKIKKLVKAISPYEKEVLAEMDMNTARVQKIKLTKKEMAQASAFSLNSTRLRGIRKDEFGNFDTFSVELSPLKNAAKDLFGLSIKSSYFPKQDKQKRLFYDAYRKGKRIFLYANSYENESLATVVKQELSGKGKEYTVKRYLYSGYWGYYTGSANRLVIYTLKKSSKSSFGYIIKSMSFQVI